MTAGRVAAWVALGLAGADCESTFDPMVEQQRCDPYEESPLFADRRVMRAPPEGTVPFGRRIERPPADPDALPTPVTLALLREGRTQFDIICATCHGVLGDGRSPVAANMALRPPPSLLAQEAGHPHGHDHAAHSNAYLFRVITEGFGLMPSYARELTADQRWAVIAYLRALQRSQRASLPDVLRADRAKLEGGAE